MINSLRGMNDMFYPDSALYEQFISVATKVASRYGYRFLQTPTLEQTSLFKRSVGESSDIVNKEMYQFTDKGSNDVCLRPEGTAGVVRAFIQHKLDRAGGVHRYFYHGSMFRYERPQKGRLREFHQFGIESFGIESAYEDATTILMLCDIFNELAIEYTLSINSIADENCMPAYKKMLIEFLELQNDKICEDCCKRKKLNPIRVLDCKNSNCQLIYKDAPKLLDHLCDSCNNEFEQLKSILDDNSIEYKIDTHLVRGLDYYNRTAFEFISGDIGAQNAIAGGGRYDKLCEHLGGRATPAVGAAIGLERVLELIKLGLEPTQSYYFGAMDSESIPMLIRAARIKRAVAPCNIEYRPRSLKAHLKNADKANASYCVIIGEDERKDAKLWIKNLQDNTQNRVDIDKF